MSEVSSGEHEMMHPDFQERVADVKWLTFALIAEQAKRAAGEEHDVEDVVTRSIVAGDALGQAQDLSLAMIEIELEEVQRRHQPANPQWN